MDEPENTFDAPQTPETVTEALRLVRILFHEHFCPANKVPDAQKGIVDLQMFANWLAREITYLPEDAICEKHDVDSRIWRLVASSAESGGLVAAVARVWYTIVLFERTPPTPAVKSVNLSLLVCYDDDAIANSQVYITKDMVPDSVIDDALLAQLLLENSGQLAHIVARDSLQALHDRSVRGSQYALPAPNNDPYEVFCGLILKNLPHLAPQYQTPVRHYLALFQMLLRPPIPPETQKRFREQLAKSKEHRGMSPPPPPEGKRGGFDV